MNILFISNDPSMFLVESSARARMREYAQSFGTLHILSRAPDGTSLQVDGNVTLHPYTGGKFRAVPAMEKLARTIIVDANIQIVSAQDPFEHGLIALRAIRGTTAKLHVQVHTDFLSPWFTKGGGFRAPMVRVPFLNHIRLKISKEVIPNAHAIRVVSERIRSSLKETYKNQLPPCSVIPVPVPLTPPVKVALPPHQFSFTLITVSRLEPEKRIEDILMALASIRFHYTSVGLFIVGSGSEEVYLRRMVEKLNLSANVVFLGERSDAWGLMQSANAFIQASAYEGYGRTLIEAALARTPIITTDVGIVGEVFAGYTEVLSAPVADPAALAVQIRGMVDDHQVRTELVINAHAKATEHLTANGNIIQRLTEDLAQMLVPPAPPKVVRPIV